MPFQSVPSSRAKPAAHGYQQRMDASLVMASDSRARLQERNAWVFLLYVRTILHTEPYTPSALTLTEEREKERDTHSRAHTDTYRGIICSLAWHNMRGRLFLPLVNKNLIIGIMFHLTQRHGGAVYMQLIFLSWCKPKAAKHTSTQYFIMAVVYSQFSEKYLNTSKKASSN